jgi:hypothetical protein
LGHAKSAGPAQEALKDGGGYALKTIATTVEDSQGPFHDQ